jgi:P27 family predicted phage terminase small subunit
MPARHKPLERLKATQRNEHTKSDGRPIPQMTVAVRAPANQSVVPRAPKGLARSGRTQWNNIWTAGFWLKNDQDYHWVAQIAQAYDDIASYREKIDEIGLIVTGYNGQDAANPLIAEIRKCEATIRTCLSVLGFSPTDRAKLGIIEVKARNALAEYLDKQNGRNGAK